MLPCALKRHQQTSRACTCWTFLAGQEQTQAEAGPLAWEVWEAWDLKAWALQPAVLSQPLYGPSRA